MMPPELPNPRDEGSADESQEPDDDELNSESPDRKAAKETAEDDSGDDARDDTEETGDGDEAAGKTEEPAGDETEDSDEEQEAPAELTDGLDPRIKDLAETLAGDQEITTAHSVEMTRLLGDIKKGSKSDANASELENKKEAEEAFWNSAEERLMMTANAFIRSFPGLFEWAEQLLSSAFFRIKRLMEEEPFEINNRQHFYRLSANQFRYVLLDELRRRKKDRKRHVSIEGPSDDEGRRTVPEIEGTDTGPVDRVIRIEIFEWYLKCAEKIPPDICDIFDRHCIHKQSFSAIAEDLGKPKSTVHGLYKTALNLLQRCILGPWPDDDAGAAVPKG